MKSIDNFRKFHRNNPRVFDLVLKYAYMHKDKGRTHYSIEIIINVIRHHVDLETVGDPFKINNNYKVSNFKGTKSFVLSTTNSLGGKNYFLAVCYITVGTLCMLFAFIFCIAYVRRKDNADVATN